MRNIRIATQTPFGNPVLHDGETIEKRVRRMIEDNEPIEDTAQTIYGEYQDGVLAGTDIRTDRMELAIDAMNYIHKTNLAKKQRELDGLKPKETEIDRETIKAEIETNPDKNKPLDNAEG